MRPAPPRSLREAARKLIARGPIARSAASLGAMVLARRLVFLVLVVLLCTGQLMAQRGVTTLGLRVKPVVPFTYFDKDVEARIEHARYSLSLEGGFAFGMNVRVGLTNTFSLETGLGQIQRRFQYGIENDTNGYAERAPIRYTGYELPVMGLVFIRLGERTWMNTALGASLDFYPSDVEGLLENGSIYMFRRRWSQGSVIGNLGFEWRSAKSGIFYVGATYHRPFNDLALADISYIYYGPPSRKDFPQRLTVSGSYLTVDLRYYFHEDPDKRRLRRGD